jgi:peptidoglycan endopeptidase LytF
MSRKDLIIVAVLVNAGLMAVFFVSALKSNGEEEAAIASMTPISSPISEMKVAQAGPADEIDQVLKEHVQGSSAPNMLTMTNTESSLVSQSQALGMMPTSAPNFADDLKAISQPDSLATTAPAIPVAVQEKPASTLVEVKVKKGDVLEKIAKRNGVSVEDLMKANQLSSTRLKIGQVLKVPAKGAVKSENTQVSSAADEANAQYYIVKNGDNPWTIAVKNHMKVEDLLKLNGLNEEKARRLKPGDKLRIR